jgi:hypothetical protein
MSPRPQLRLETLESRRAPATLAADHKTVTFTDIDGDVASVTFSAPVLNDTNVATVLHFDGGMLPNDNTTPQQLQTIDLTGLTGVLSVTVKATTVVGDGKVDVGWVNATGKDVGTVTISGDLGRVTAGDATTKTPGLRALNVGSLGVRDPAVTQEPGGNLLSVVNGSIGSLTVAGAVHWASVSATGGADGKIGLVKIGGDLAADPATASTGLIQAEGAIGLVSIGGNVVGSDQPTSGLLAGGILGPVTVLGNIQGGIGTDSAAIIGNLGIRGLTVGSKTAAGSVTGGTGAGSASIRTSGGNIGRVTITGGLIGGTGAGSAAIRSVTALGKGGNIGPVTITGDVTGDATGTDSASIRADGIIASVRVGSLTGRADRSGSVHAGGAVGPVTVNGDVTGGAGVYSGSVIGGGSIRAVTVNGNVTGVSGMYSGEIAAGVGNMGPAPANLGPVVIRGDLTGGAGPYSGSVEAYTALISGKLAGGRIAAVTITGDVTGGTGKYSGAVYGADRIGLVRIGTAAANGSLTGGGGAFSGSVVAAGAGIAAVTVFGDVTGGAGDFSAAINTNGRLGPVAVHANGVGNKGDVTGGNGIRSASIHGLTVARVTVDGSVTGGQGINSASIIADRTIGAVIVNTDWVGASIAAGVDPGVDGYFGTGDDATVFAGSIGSMTIKGTADGSAATFSSTDYFAFTANWVKSLKINGATIVLTPGKGNDKTAKPLGTTGDFVVMELP